MRVPVLDVSILVFVELALGPGTRNSGNHSTLPFQSLFSWNLPSDYSKPGHSKPGSGFQSLFSWNLPSDANPDKAQERAITSFNPCFRGTCPRTIMYTRSCALFMIVSILVFVELALGPFSVETWISKSKFQSLFSWNLPSDPL